MPVLRASVSDIHHTFFCEKLASSIAPKLYIAVFKCKRFSEIGGQQLLLDMHAVKAILLSLPAIAAAGTDVTAEPSAPPMSYAKMIAREMGKVEALVKTILSPNDGLAETFKALLPMTANATDFKAICLLKGMKPNEISEPPFGLFASVGAPASSKPLEDLPNVPNRPKAPRMDNVTAKMSGIFKQGTKQ
jgi:hypothetical protein